MPTLQQLADDMLNATTATDEQVFASLSKEAGEDEEIEQQIADFLSEWDSEQPDATPEQLAELDRMTEQLVDEMAGH